MTREAPQEQKVLEDAQTMRALSHPVRIALLEALTVHGPLTATAAGEQIGESPTTCSFHLRQLAKHGLVEEAGGGKGRSRPWKRSARGFRFSTVHEGDPETEVAASVLARMYNERTFGRARRYFETSAAYPRQWREAATNSSHTLWLTPEELAALAGELNQKLIELSVERNDDPATRPDGARPVEFLLLGYPMQTTTEEPS